MNPDSLNFYPYLREPVFPAPKTYANVGGGQPQADESLKLRPENLASKSKAKKYRQISLTLLVLGIFLVLTAWGPSAFFYIAKRAGVDLNTRTIGETVIKNDELTQKIRLKPSSYQPPQDTNLPTESRLKISSIGIDTAIYEAVDSEYEEALKKGIWRVSEFGTPYDRQYPMILAAHRFGYLAWSIPYRLKNSFYSLPKAKIGDTVEIIWNQRKYTYAIYAESEGESINNELADLILYTCKDLESSVRIFKYAKLLQI